MAVRSLLSSTAALARGALGLMFVLTALAMPARADRDNDNGNGLKKGHDKHDPPPIGAPEIDPGSMLGGVTLLAGGALILADRCRRRTPQLGAD